MNIKKMPRPQSITILGIDPGTAIVGYAVIKEEGRNVTLVEADAIQPDTKIASERLKIIYSSIIALIDIHRPDVISLEKIFFSKNIKTAIQVAEARGVLLLTAAQKSINFFEYTPLEVKNAVTGYGKADKHQVQTMICRILKVSSIPKLDDVTDAMAVAFTALQDAHAYIGKLHT